LATDTLVDDIYRMIDTKEIADGVPVEQVINDFGENVKQILRNNITESKFDKRKLRMLAHYMNDEAYTNEILNGDIHSANQKSAGLQTRDQAKTFIYAFLYGAGDGKIGEVAGGGPKRGRILKKNFLDNTPALKHLRSKVADSSKKGWVTGLDGRKLHIRSEHSALNTLLQSAGAVVMKKALVLLDTYAKQYNIDYKFVLNVHDEFQCEVRDDQADFFGGLAVGAIIKAGKSFNLNCPLDGEYKVGKTWQQTH